MRPVVRAAVLLLFVWTGVPVAAQTEQATGSHLYSASPARIPDVHGMVPADRARATLIAFAQCLAISDRIGVEHALAAPPIGVANHKALDRIAESHCLADGQLKMDEALMRGALYTALYRIDFAKQQPALPVVPLDYAKDVGSLADESARQYVALRQFADCVVREDVPDSRQLVLAQVASNAEGAAFVALSPHFNACMLQGIQLKFGKALLSVLIGETLYRESRAAQTGGMESH